MKKVFTVSLAIMFAIGVFFAFNSQQSSTSEENISLNEDVKEQREKAAEEKKKEEQRVKNLINEDKLIKVSDDTINIYYKVASDKFIGYEILHSESSLDTTVNSSNYDIWHLNNANLYSYENGEFDKISDFITYGEWDFTIKETGSNDYSGGKTHGDEITNSVEITVDGNEPEIDKLVAFDGASIKTDTTIYRDNTIESDVEIAQKSRTLFFNEDQLMLEQEINFANDLTIDRAYLAMLPVLRTDQAGDQITDTAIVDGESFDISQPDFEIDELNNYQSNTVTLTGSESGLSATVTVEETNIEPVELTVSNNAAYNKIYFKNGGENVNVRAGEVWNQVTNYEFDYNK